MNPIVIGLHGKKRSGKDTVAQYLVQHYGYRQMAFADVLKEACAVLLGMPIETQYGGDREAIMEEWGFSIRQLQQIVGTEIVRHLSPDFWVIRLRKEAAKLQVLTNQRPIVISDCRFENEAAWIRSLGVVFAIDRPGLPHDAHVSEAGIMLTEDDYVLSNNADFAHLYGQIDRVMANFRKPDQ